MSSVSALAQRLGVVAGFEDPQVGLEQYPTPPDLAAHLIHVADLQGDVEGQRVIDLGTGTGMLALGAALRGPASVVGIDVDPDPRDAGSGADPTLVFPCGPERVGVDVDPDDRCRPPERRTER